MDLFDLVAYISIDGNKYGLVIVDDYSHFAWVFFLQDKSETQEALKKFLRRVQNKFNVKVKKTRSDNSTKFKNTQVENFLDEEDIKHEFLAIYTPQQNGVAKRKNHTLIEMARSMLDEYKTSDRFWVKAINMACHATNRLYLRKLLKKTSYKLLTGNKPNVSYFLFLEVSAMFYIRGKSFLNLLLKFMRVSCLVMIQILAHTVFLM
jgi:transposase InsO family protein